MEAFCIPHDRWGNAGTQGSRVPVPEQPEQGAREGSRERALGSGEMGTGAGKLSIIHNWRESSCMPHQRHAKSKPWESVWERLLSPVGKARRSTEYGRSRLKSGNTGTPWGSAGKGAAEHR